MIKIKYLDLLVISQHYCVTIKEFIVIIFVSHTSLEARNFWHKLWSASRHVLTLSKLICYSRYSNTFTCSSSFFFLVLLAHVTHMPLVNLCLCCVVPAFADFLGIFKSFSKCGMSCLHCTLIATSLIFFIAFPLVLYVLELLPNVCTTLL